MKKALTKRSGQQNNELSAAPQMTNGIPNSALADVFSGRRSATEDMMGRREELAPSIAAKMSQAFGMDFSAVKVYRSDAMAGTELQGMAQGDRVVLSSAVDLNTQAGQATLGHELSHIRAQSMGIGSGRGLLNDAFLERQADTEGLLAARGMNIYGESMGMSTGFGMAGVEDLAPIGGGIGASAGAPMQAEKQSRIADRGAEETADMMQASSLLPPQSGAEAKDIDYQRVLGKMVWKKGKNDFSLSTPGIDTGNMQKNGMNLLHADNQEKMTRLIGRTKGIPGETVEFSLGENGERRMISGLGINRINTLLTRSWGTDHSDEEIMDVMTDLSAGYAQLTEDGNLVNSGEEHPKDAKYDKARVRGLNKYKNILYRKMKSLENNYGTVLTQMHPHDIMERMGAKNIMYYALMMQDARQIFLYNYNESGVGQFLAENYDDPERDEDMRRMIPYYSMIFQGLQAYLAECISPKLGHQSSSNQYMVAKSFEDQIRGPRMGGDMKKWYDYDMRKKISAGEYEDIPQNLHDKTDVEKTLRREQGEQAERQKLWARQKK